MQGTKKICRLRDPALSKSTYLSFSLVQVRKRSKNKLQNYFPEALVISNGVRYARVVKAMQRNYKGVREEKARYITWEHK